MIYVSKAFAPADVATCPHCGKDEGEHAGDYVIPKREGEASRGQHVCGWCDGTFTAVRRGEHIVITAGKAAP
jgi:hypothetical protein